MKTYKIGLLCLLAVHALPAQVHSAPPGTAFSQSVNQGEASTGMRPGGPPGMGAGGQNQMGGPPGMGAGGQNQMGGPPGMGAGGQNQMGGPPGMGGGQGQMGGGRNGPPREALVACQGLSAGAACRFVGRMGEQLSGTCFQPPAHASGQQSPPMACRPANAPGGGNGPGGSPGGAQRGGQGAAGQGLGRAPGY
ncbi:MAG: hypothetical protein H7836_08730 [Magnetococcus sp. YQC-3]